MASHDSDESECSPEVEIYSLERKAEFLLSNAIDKEDYEDALAEVREMRLDPADIPHIKPVE